MKNSVETNWGWSNEMGQVSCELYVRLEKKLIPLFWRTFSFIIYENNNIFDNFREF